MVVQRKGVAMNGCSKKRSCYEWLFKEKRVSRDNILRSLQTGSLRKNLAKLKKLKA